MTAKRYLRCQCAVPHLLSNVCVRSRLIIRSQVHQYLATNKRFYQDSILTVTSRRLQTFHTFVSLRSIYIAEQIETNELVGIRSSFACAHVEVNEHSHLWAIRCTVKSER